MHAVSEPVTATASARCRVCSAAFESREVRLGANCLRATVCPVCEDEEKARAEASLTRPKASRWERLCPAEYREFDPDGHGLDRRAVSRAMAWRFGPRGLVIHGDTGSGKTRILWALLRQQIERDDIGAAVYDAPALGNEIAAAFRDGNERGFLLFLEHAELLAIDDLGQEKVTERVAETLWGVLERRTRSRRPVIVTTQFVGDSLCARFENRNQGVAVVRRLREFCEAVHVRKRNDPAEARRMVRPTSSDG